MTKEKCFGIFCIKLGRGASNSNSTVLIAQAAVAAWLAMRSINGLRK
jgi:hypothetical protein